MATLVVGASEATGQLLVEQLLNRGEVVKIIVRAESNLSQALNTHEHVSIIYGSILELTDEELAQHVKGCHAIASCLGHNLSFKGIFGYPRRLVTDAIRRLCHAIKAHNPTMPVKVVLKNTTGNRNRDLLERISFGQTCVIWLLRIVLPPHVDNENAAEVLRTELGQDDSRIEWVVVRQDSLTTEKHVTKYEVYPSPIRSAIFNTGITSRMNVGHFIAELITHQDTWMKWRGRMPVIYNLE